MSPHRRLRPSLPSGATVGIALATFLVGVSIAGTPLYASSAASAAVVDQLAHACPSDSALTLEVPPGVPVADVAATATSIPHVGSPVLSTVSSGPIERDSAVTKGIYLVTRDGAPQHVQPPLRPLGPDEIAMPHDVLRTLGVHVGDRLAVRGDGGASVSLRITQEFDDLPFRPEPPFWCGFPWLLRPNQFGDPGPPWGLVSSETQGAFAARTARWLEYVPTSDAITMRDARRLEGAFAATASVHTATYGPRLAQTSLPELLDHASGLTTGVERTVTPTGLAGLVAAVITLLAASTFAARERARELTLLAVRGQSTWRTAVGLAPSSALPVVLGAVLGGVAALVGVRELGPSPAIDRHRLLEAAAALGVASVVALGIVVARVARIGDRMVDSGPARRHRGIPFELAAIPLAIISWRRLADGHGLRMIGVRPQGGELLAQAFPLLGLVSLVALIHRPLRWIAHGARVACSRLPRAVRLGFRRAVIDARAASLLVVVFTMAAGCFTTSRLLARTSEQELRDKAQNFVGGDVAVDVYGDAAPVRPGVTSTEVSRIAGHLGGETVEILGVDRATFARVAHLRSGTGTTLDELLRSIAPTGGAELPAIMVGDPSLQGSLRLGSTVGRPDIVVDVVASVPFFPGSSSGPMAVVDRQALEAQADFGRHSIWFRDPPADVVEQLRADGARVGPVARASTVFDTTNYRAQTWSYDPLAALGTVFLLIAIGIQLLVVNARAVARQQADVVMRRTGFRTWHLWCASCVEVGIPSLLGTVVGVAAAAAVVGLSMDHLDTLPGVAPPPRLVLTPGAVLLPVAAMLVVIALVSGVVVRSTRHSDPMRAIRGLGGDG